MPVHVPWLCLVAVMLSICSRVWSSEIRSGIGRRDKMFFLQQTDGKGNILESKLLVVTWQPKNNGESGGCEVFDDQNLIEEVLSSTSNPQIQTSTGQEIKDFLKDCTEITMRKKRQTDESNSNRLTTRTPVTVIRQNSKETVMRQNSKETVIRQNSKETRQQDTTETRQQDTTETRQQDTTDSDSTTVAQEWEGQKKGQTTTEGYGGLPVIWPGTKWCGAGDIAKNYDDLGLHVDTDKCCRSHDLCNDTLAPGETRNNLTNKSPFTKLSCKCDNDFHDCLSRVDSVVSNGIGNIYFNVLRRECYKLDYPLTSKCKRYRSLLKITCKEYARNTKVPKVNQWISAKKYKKLPFPGPIGIEIPF